MTSAISSDLRGIAYGCTRAQVSGQSHAMVMLV